MFRFISRRFFRSIRSLLSLACIYINGVVSTEYDWLWIGCAGKINALCNLFCRPRVREGFIKRKACCTRTGTLLGLTLTPTIWLSQPYSNNFDRPRQIGHSYYPKPL